MKIGKRDTTATKIDLARDAIADFSIDTYAPHVPIYRRVPKHMPMHTKGTDTIPISNKRLCGELGSLCLIMRRLEIPYPWRQA